MLLASGATIDSRNITGGIRGSTVGGEDQMMTAERDAKNQQHIFCLLQKNVYQYGVRCNQKRSEPVFLVRVRPPTTVCSTQTMAVSNASQNPIKKLFGI